MAQTCDSTGCLSFDKRIIITKGNGGKHHLSGPSPPHQQHQQHQQQPHRLGNPVPLFSLACSSLSSPSTLALPTSHHHHNPFQRPLLLHFLLPVSPPLSCFSSAAAETFVTLPLWGISTSPPPSPCPGLRPSSKHRISCVCHERLRLKKECWIEMTKLMAEAVSLPLPSRVPQQGERLSLSFPPPPPLSIPEWANGHGPYSNRGGEKDNEQERLRLHTGYGMPCYVLARRRFGEIVALIQ